MNNKKFARPRLLVVGCGDVGMRLLPHVVSRFRVFALTTQSERCDELRRAGAIPLVADLDRPATLARLRGLARHVVHLAPPQGTGSHDLRTRHLAAILPDGAHVVYISTTGVYGDCGGAAVDETRPVAPQSDRAARRADAERVLRDWAAGGRGRVSILRAPGIYAADRLPLQRLQNGTPALLAPQDVYSNHVHADDLALAALIALFRGRPSRVYNAVDDSQLRMGDYFDAVADAFGLPRPPRMARDELARHLSAVQMSFMAESRRLDNARLRRELGMRLRHPDAGAAVAMFGRQAALAREGRVA